MAAVPPPMPSAPPIVAPPAPPDAWAGIETPPPAPPRDPRVWATVLIGAAATVTAVFTSFAPWAHYADGVDTTGIEHGDGWIAIALAFVAAGLCGAVAVGLRHLAARLALAGVGVATFGLYLRDRYQIGRAVDLVTGQELTVGGGLYVLAFAALGFVVAALAMPSQPWWGPRAEARAARRADTSSTAT
jgi:hypothetical protein